MEEEAPTWPILIQHIGQSGPDQFKMIWDQEKMPINKPIRIKYFASSMMVLNALREGYLLGKADAMSTRGEDD
jgi:hypothetical protein